MKFRTKIIFSFSVVVFLVSSFLGISYYRLNSKSVRSTAKQNLEFWSEQLAERIDQSFDSMKQISDYILSDKDMLYAMQALPGIHEQNKTIERKKQVAVLTSGISTDYIIRNFYRVVYFNEMGDVACSTNYEDLNIDKNRDVSQFEWLEQVSEQKGKPVLIAPHEDDWGMKRQDEVYSLARKVQGGDFGYLEIQRSAESLGEIFELVNPDMNVIAALPDGTLLYRSDDSLDPKTILQDLDIENVRTITLDDKEMLRSVEVSKKFGIIVVGILNQRTVLEDVERALILAGTVAMVCFAVLMAVVIVIANKLSNPIIKLKEQMENTGIDNLDEVSLDYNTNDEMEALSRAYENLLKRLNESIVKEKRLSILQLQAQFDTLQAQINPHFIYNVLNVISNRGIMDGDDEICELCGSLAAMLRYSTNNKERYATAEEEVNYLKKYIFLLKSRYRERMEVEISCEPEVMKEIMPKIVLQQLVENSIQHGFVNGMSVMKIQVRGWKDESGWYFEVRDNGQGISDEIMEELESKIENIKSKILSKRSNIEMEIGGMGLGNIYARMFLLYADRAVLHFENLEKGLGITIGVAGKEEGEHVSCDDC